MTLQAAAPEGDSPPSIRQPAVACIFDDKYKE